MIADAAADIALTATLARLERLAPTLGAPLIERPTDGWMAARDWISDRRRLDDALAHIAATYRVPDWQPTTRYRHVVAAFLINSYAWFLPAAAIAAYLTEKRVPDLDPDNVVVRLRSPDEGGLFEIGLLSSRMAVLPDDPAAGAAEATVLHDTVQLRAWLRRRIEAHMAPLIEAVHRHTGFSRRAQWNLVADDCAALFLWIGQRIGAEERACVEGRAFVGAAGSPMQASRTAYITLDVGGQRHTFRKRGGCCLYYRLPGGQHCSTCALLPAQEREQRLRASITSTQENKHEE
ncbi:IucA/IucC family C-terminal-domain containing protein [Kallotenue papyrolyticum]|uniref:IucA/IucC family C-terminal-domain containing protein n=1 Tax=Kallotenue papyrolyticum TaxID=1325125 RepID=UPI00047858EF|nr:ferric iron reductase [Kallotenue papyrolyticum]